MSLPDSIKNAKRWWGKNVNDRPVWRIEDLPDSQYKDILISLRLAYEIRRDVIALGKPDTEISVLIHNYFWEMLSCILKPYAPYAITGIAAIHFYLGDESIPKKVDIITKNSSNKIDIFDVSSLVLEKNISSDQLNHLKQMKTKKNYIFFIESPECLLIKLRPQYFRDYPHLISGFVKSVDFDLENLNKLLLEKSRPITLLRLAALFEQVGKSEEALIIKDKIKLITQYSIPGKSQIIKTVLPSIIAAPKRKSDPPYVTRFRDQLSIYKSRISEILKDMSSSRLSLQDLKDHIQKTKKYDTYHSSTIEGYRVTPEEIQMLMDGQEITSAGKSREEIERKMALKGYLEAHHFVLQSIEKHYKKNIPLSELMIREIYAHLFSPSVESGLLTKTQLTQYRNDAVYIRHSRFVPPNYLKIDDLMRCLVEEINETEDSITQAIIAHYGFVTIHPYFDGNGRVTRFLMNYLLCRDGYSWVTIRIEDRDEYFSSLEIAQCDENIIPFVAFLKKYFFEK
jgi:fido (protein-threonine AMPylation protein)